MNFLELSCAIVGVAVGALSSQAVADLMGLRFAPLSACIIAAVIKTGWPRVVRRWPLVGEHTYAHTIGGLVFGLVVVIVSALKRG